MSENPTLEETIKQLENLVNAAKRFHINCIGSIWTTEAEVTLWTTDAEVILKALKEYYK